MTKGPRILLWDIETTFNVVAVFKLWGDQYIPHESLLQESYIVCAAWKWLGEKRVHAVSVLDNKARYAKNPHDDQHVIETLHAVLSEADVIVAHNGDAFDLKKFRARAIHHGLPPIPPIKTVDTKKLAKKHFSFNHNRLDYLGAFLGLGRKRDTAKGLWLRVLKGEAKAVRSMVWYNRGDVILLEQVYHKFLPYIEGPINRHLYTSTTGCPRCGSRNVHSRGVARTVARAYSRYQCQACGGWFRTDLVKGHKTHTKLVA